MKKKTKTVTLCCLGGVLAAIAAGDAVFISSHYTWAGGGLRSKNSQALNLRGQDISLTDYLDIQEKFPSCPIYWDVPLGDRKFPSYSSALTVSTLRSQDFKSLECFPNLTALDASGCREYESLEAYRQSHPQCRVTFTLSLSGQEYPNDAQRITVANARAEELTTLLPYFYQLNQVELTGILPEQDALKPLLAAFPGINFCWEDAGLSMESSTVYLNLGPQQRSAEEIFRLAELLPHLREIRMGGAALERSDLEQLAQQLPGVLLLQDVTIGSHTVSTGSQEVDLSGVSLTVAEVEKLVPCFPKADRFILCGCGIDDETMDALNRKYADIRFVWSVRIKNVDVRTDTKWFYPFKYYREMTVNEEDLYPLRYCTDIEALDIGHMGDVKTCEWLRYMPNMKYLILVETGITDISPVATLKNLVFLEIFTTNITDYSPLLECTALEDLNLGKTYGDPAPIMKMTWLKNLWWMGIEGNTRYPYRNTPEKLREALPNTTMKFYLETPNVDNGWRQLENYYHMRDLMDVFYLT